MSVQCVSLFESPGTISTTCCMHVFALLLDKLNIYKIVITIGSVLSGSACSSGLVLLRDQNSSLPSVQHLRMMHATSLETKLSVVSRFHVGLEKTWASKL
jgi:hypothetical protein